MTTSTKTKLPAHGSQPALTPLADQIEKAIRFAVNAQEQNWALAQRLNRLELEMQHLAENAVPRQAWQRLDHDVESLRDDLRRVRPIREFDPSFPR